MCLLSVTKLVFATYQTLLSQLIHPSLLRPTDRSVRTLLYTYLLQFNKQNPCQFPLKCYIIYNSYTIKGSQVTSARANVSPAYTRFLKPSNSPTNSTFISFSNFFISSASRSRISVVTIAMYLCIGRIPHRLPLSAPSALYYRPHLCMPLNPMLPSSWITSQLLSTIPGVPLIYVNIFFHIWSWKIRCHRKHCPPLRLHLNGTCIQRPLRWPFLSTFLFVIHLSIAR